MEEDEVRSGACLGLTGARCRQEEERRPGSLPPKCPRVMATPGALPRERYSERCPGTVGGARLHPAAYWQPR